MSQKKTSGSGQTEFDLEKLLDELVSEAVDTRISASDRLAIAAEGGADLSGAIDALGRALTDEHPMVRVNMAWLAAFLSTNGLDLSPILEVVTRAVTDEVEIVRINACCTLMETAKRADISAAFPALVQATAEKATRPNATNALRFSLDFPGSQEKAREELKAALTDHRQIVAAAAAETLTLHNTRKESWGEVTSLLQHVNSAVRQTALVAMISANKGSPLPSEAHLALVAGLSDEEPEVRALASSLLSSLAESGQDVSPAIAALAKATSDEQEEVRKDALGALYGAARQGIDIAEALPALEQCMKEFFNGPVKNRAAVAAARHYLQVGRQDVVRDMLETDSFGAAWAVTDHCCASGETDELARIVRSLRPGIGARDQGIRQGIAGSINYAEGRKPDGSIALQVIQQVLDANQDTPAEAAIQGIYFQLQKLKE